MSTYVTKKKYIARENGDIRRDSKEGRPDWYPLFFTWKGVLVLPKRCTCTAFQIYSVSSKFIFVHHHLTWLTMAQPDTQLPLIVDKPLQTRPDHCLNVQGCESEILNPCTSARIFHSSLPSLLGCEASFAAAGAALEPKSLAVEAPEETSRMHTLTRMSTWLCSRMQCIMDGRGTYFHLSKMLPFFLFLPVPCMTRASSIVRNVQRRTN